MIKNVKKKPFNFLFHFGNLGNTSPGNKIEYACHFEGGSPRYQVNMKQ